MSLLLFFLVADTTEERDDDLEVVDPWIVKSSKRLYT